jgi:hypothetical protein
MLRQFRRAALAMFGATVLVPVMAVYGLGRLALFLAIGLCVVMVIFGLATSPFAGFHSLVFAGEFFLFGMVLLVLRQALDDVARTRRTAADAVSIRRQQWVRYER